MVSPSSRRPGSRSCGPAWSGGTTSSSTGRSRPSGSCSTPPQRTACVAGRGSASSPTFLSRKQGEPPSLKEQVLTKVVNALKGHDGLLAWKSVDEPRNPFRGDELDPPCRARPRLREAEGTRPESPGRDHPDAGEHGRGADAVPARARHHRRRHLSRLLPAGHARRVEEHRRQRGRRRDEDAARRRPARSPCG